MFVAVIAFRQWWRRSDRRWRWAGAYVVCTVLAGWMHLITLPFTLLPFIFCGIAGLRDLGRHKRHAASCKIRGLLLLGALTAGLLASTPGASSNTVRKAA